MTRNGLRSFNRTRTALEIDRLFGAGKASWQRFALEGRSSPRRSHPGLVEAVEQRSDQQRGDGPSLPAPAERPNAADF